LGQVNHIEEGLIQVAFITVVMVLQALLIALSPMYALASNNKFFEMRGCGTDPANPYFYKGYRSGFAIDVCVITEDGSSSEPGGDGYGSLKYVESTAITYYDGIKYISVDYSMYSSSDCSGLPYFNQVNSYMTECPLVPIEAPVAAYLTDFPTSDGSAGSILVK
jgi:hypothetical protein